MPNYAKMTKAELIKELERRRASRPRVPFALARKANERAGKKDTTRREQAEEKQQSTEAGYRSIFENALEGIYQSSPQGRFTRVNPAMARLLGYASPDELVSSILSIRDQFYADPLRRAAAMEQLAQEGKLEDFESECLRKDGSRIWISENVRAVRDAAGTLLYYEGFIRDITERKRTEQALRDSEDRYRGLFEHLVEGYAYCQMIIEDGIAQDLTYLAVNAAFESLTGLKDVTGKRVSEVIPGVRKTDPELFDIYARVSLTGQHERFEMYVNALEAWYSISVYSPAQGYFVAVFDVITERKRAVEKLRESEERFRALIEHSHDAITLLAADGTVMYDSPSITHVLGYGPTERLGHPVFEFVQPEERQKMADGFARFAVQIGAIDLSVVRFLHKDGTLRQIEGVRTNLLHEPAVRAVVVNYRDITERKLAEDAARASEAQYRALVEQAADGIFITDVVGHYLDVNTSGCAMLGYTREELLGKDYTLILSPEDIAQDPPRLDLLPRGKILLRERLYRRKDGTVLPVEISAKMLSDGRVQSIVRDISERKQIEVERKRRAEQLAALNDAALKIQQHLDAGEIYRNACDELRRFGVLASVYHIEPDGQLRHVYTSMTPELSARYVERFGDRVLDFAIPGAVLAGSLEKLLTQANVLNLETFQILLAGTSPEVRGLVDWVRQQVARATILLAPLTRDGKPVDLLTVLGDSLDEADLPAVSLFARQVSVALENARLFAAEQARRAELAALYDLSRALVDAQGLDESFKLIVQSAVETTHITFARIASLEDDALVIRATFPIRTLARASSVAGHAAAVDDEWRRRVLGQNDPVVLYADDPSLNARAREMLFMGIASSACVVPLHANRAPIGLLILAEERNPLREPFGAEKQRLARAIGDQAASALHRAALHEETTRRVEQLEALKSIDRVIAASFDLPITLHVLLEHLAAQLHVDAAAVLLLEPRQQTLDYAAGRGFRTRQAQDAHIRLGQDFAGRAALERHIIRVDDFSQMQATPHFAALWADEGFAAYYGVPLIVKGQVKGVLEVYQRAPFHPNSDWMSYMEMLTGQAALAIDNAQLFQNLEHSNTGLVLAYDSTIEGWSRALDLRDKETEGHTQRVTEISVRLARAMGIDDADLVHVRRGALLHDIGKMGVPDRILLKPGGLDADEWAIMRKHPVFAFELLSPIAYLQSALDVPYCHHEKWDGTGYPRGLKSEQIPLAARVFAIVDVWDALRSDRPYRAAWTAEKARENIVENTNKHFDPAVVKAFLSMLDRGELDAKIP